ncbi:MAG: non-ribosomal peptide synthetase, partial [Chloroflexota bacterium]
MTNEACVSFAQRRFLFLHQLEQGSPTYNVPFAFLVHGPLYPFALERAFNRVVARHAALRTAFRFESAADEAGEAAPDEPRQYWPDQLYVPLQVDDLSSLPAEQRLAAARELAREEGRRLFDLAVPPLFRLRLLRLDPQQHVLLLTVQHAIIDEWSSEVLFRELDALYEDENGGQEADLPELAAQYADFARWQAGWLAGEPVGGAVSPVERQLAFWTERLSGAPAALELPTDAPRPAQATFRGGMAFHQLDAELAGRLLKLAAAERVTLFSAGLAAFAVFLSRSSAQADLVIGSPIANRSRAEFRHLVGVFLNTLALRFDLKDDPSFSELLRRTGRMMLDSFGHQDLPLERLVEALNPPRDAGRHPLFQAAFVLQPASNAGLRLGEAQVEPLKIDYGWSKFDLTLFVSQRRAAQPGTAAGQGSGGAAARTGALDLRLEYAADLFTPDSAQRMLARFETLLRSALDRPDLPVSRLAMLTPGELAFELQDCSRSARPYPRQSSIPAQFREAAARFAAAPALEFGQVCLTYAELDRRAGRLAQRLAQLGVRRGSLVGLAMERSAAMVVGMLGILQAGGAYVPLDPSYPAERLAFMAGDSELRLLVHGAGSPGLPLEGVITVSLDESGEPVDGPVAQGAHSLDGPGELPGPEDPAYLMYTSGSTGQPKGILVPQRAVLRLVLGADYCQVQPGERIAQASNMSFDAATFEVWGALLNGACLVGFPQQVVLAPAEYARWIREKRIDHLFVTTALFNLVAALQPEAFATAQTVMVGGEAVSPAMMRQVLRAGRPRRLMNIYGPTENTTFSTWQPVDDVPEQAASIPIGRPVANTSAYVLDAARQPLPVGVPGELYLGGDGLASGYWRRPELTAEKFVPNPFPEQPGVRYSPRLYRTGDRVLRRPGGEIEFLERIDTQVKLRG